MSDGPCSKEKYIEPDQSDLRLISIAIDELQALKPQYARNSCHEADGDVEEMQVGKAEQFS